MTEFETVYRTYFRDVELYLRAICKDESLAEELTEQVFFQAMKALPKFRGDCDIRTWLCAMGRNCYLSHLRKCRPSEDITNCKFRIPERPLRNRSSTGLRLWPFTVCFTNCRNPIRRSSPCVFLGSFPLRTLETYSAGRQTGPV